MRLTREGNERMIGLTIGVHLVAGPVLLEFPSNDRHGFRADIFADAEPSAYERGADEPDVRCPRAAAELQDAAVCRVNSFVVLRGLRVKSLRKTKPSGPRTRARRASCSASERSRRANCATTITARAPP